MPAKAKKTSQKKPPKKIPEKKKTKTLEKNPGRKIKIDAKRQVVSEDESDDADIIDENPDDEEFFDVDKFSEFNPNVKFHVFDSEKYITRVW